MKRSFLPFVFGVCSLFALQSRAATITGTVKISNGNNPSGAVTIRASNGASVATTAPTWSTYSLTVPDGWTGSLIASFAPSGNYLVNVPAYHAVTNASGAYVKDFTLTVGIVENLSGTVTKSGGGGLSNVLVYASSGAGGGAIAGTDGSYVFGVLAAAAPPNNKWTGAVTPLAAGYTFTPATTNYSARSCPITGCNFVGTSSGSGDAQTPTWPQGAKLNATNVTSSGSVLFWTAAQDNVSVVGYRLYRNAETSACATVTGATNTTVSGLSPLTSYTYKVEAYDAAANATTNGPSVQFTTANVVPAMGKILFTRKVTNTDWDLWTMNRDGSGQAVLLDSDCEDRMPRFSNDGSKIVFTRNTNGTGDVYTVNAEGGQITNLTADLPNSAFSGRFSWDSAKICFDYFVGITNHDIYIMNADGTGKRAVVNTTTGDDTTPAFSPDNGWLVFQRKTVSSETDPRSVICKVRTNGMDFAVLTDNSELDEMPVFTPDGNYILFKRGGRTVGPVGEIYRMDTNGGGLTNLTHNGVQNDSPAVAPENDLYAFMSVDSGDMEIYTMNTDGTSQTKRTDNSVADFDPSFSPASGSGGGGVTLPVVATNRVVFSRHTATPPNQKAKLVLMDINGSNEVDLTEGTSYFDTLPYFNPQGTRIVFARGSTTTFDVMSINADGTGLTNLTADIDDKCNCPHWSWDGSKIAFDRATTNAAGINGDLYIMDPDGRNKTLVLGVSMAGAADDSSAFFSPDGRWLAFQRLVSPEPNPRSEIWKVEIATGETVQLSQLTPGADDEVDETPAWSPDGLTVTFKRGLDLACDLWAVDAAAGANLRNLTSRGDSPMGEAHFTFDGAHIIYQTNTGGLDPDTSEIFRMDANGSNRVQLTSNSVPDWDPAPSPRYGGALPVSPVIAVSTNRLTPECVVGQTAAATELLVRNTGGGTLTYAVSTNAGWLSVSPTNGSCAYEQDVLAVAYASASLSAGEHTAVLTIASQGATNSPLTVTVSLHVKETWEDGFNAWLAGKVLPQGEESPYDDPDHDGFDTLSEYIADTLPTASNSFLHIVGILPGPPVSVTFEPASTGRVYTLQANTNGLQAGAWHTIVGQTRQPGAGGADLLEDAGGGDSVFYRVSVELP